jgi:hypothetical protein
MTKTAIGYHGLVVFLWGLTNRMGSNTSLIDMPDYAQTDAKGQQVIWQILQGTQAVMPSEPNVTLARTQTSEQPARMSNALINDIKAMMDTTLKSIKREDLKKSILSHLSREAADLFLPLFAKDWNDLRPGVHTFARQTLLDRDMMKVANLMTPETRSWRGSVSSRGLPQFLSTGYTATGRKIQPGGITIFMFYPKTGSISIS